MVEALTGSVLDGRFKIIGEVGRGRFAIVYKALDEETDESVAVKVLHEEVSPEGKDFLRFKREAELAAALEHPNIASVYGFGVADYQFPYVVMEYVTGLLLSARLSFEGRLPFKTAAPILIQICDAMSYAHEQGIIHRDLRPENVFLEEIDGKADVVKIVDFGVAKNIKSHEQKRLTGEGELLGTPEYASLEQILGEEIDARADIYSMGCLMYKMLSGQLPFSGRTAGDILMQKAESAPLDFSDPSRGRHLPQSIQDVVKQSISNEVSERPQSMQEIRTIIEKCL
ncbi:MAG TPA: serine/threonine-protein kinase [Chroococcales cyanobacterium]